MVKQKKTWKDVVDALPIGSVIVSSRYGMMYGNLSEIFFDDSRSSVRVLFDDAHFSPPVHWTERIWVPVAILGAIFLPRNTEFSEAGIGTPEHRFRTTSRGATFTLYVTKFVGEYEANIEG